MTTGRGKTTALLAGIAALVVLGALAFRLREGRKSPSAAILDTARGTWYIQVQSLLFGEHFASLAEYVAGLGHYNILKVPMNTKVQGRPVFILRLGPYPSREDAAADLDRFKAKNRAQPFTRFPNFKLQLAFPIEVSDSRDPR